jgi:AcrR family transcriptional regulator
MPRPAKHDEARILSAAAALVAAGGPGAATISSIGQAIGAPNGSIYHRFRSRDELLGRLWLTKAAVFQDAWAEALAGPDPVEAGLDAALSLPRVARRDPEGARIMLLHRREDFESQAWSPLLRAEAERLGRQISERIDETTRRLFGRNTGGARRTTTFALLDLPYAAVRRHVAAHEALPPTLDDLITTAYRAVIKGQVET